MSRVLITTARDDKAARVSRSKEPPQIFSSFFDDYSKR
jgi:hypothetical protein